MEVRYRHLERRVAFAMTASRLRTPVPYKRVQRTRPSPRAFRSLLPRGPLGESSVDVWPPLCGPWTLRGRVIVDTEVSCGPGFRSGATVWR